MGCHGNGAISHSPNHIFSSGKILFALSLSQWTICYPWKIVLWGGCKVGLISRRPSCLVTYFCFQRLFLFKLHIFNLKILARLVKHVFYIFFPVVTLDSYLIFNTWIYWLTKETLHTFFANGSYRNVESWYLLYWNKWIIATMLFASSIIHPMETVLRVPGESSGVNWRKL